MRPKDLHGGEDSVPAEAVDDDAREGIVAADPPSSRPRRHDGLPLAARVFGALVALVGAATLPVVVMSTVGALRRVAEGRESVDALDLTFILFCLRILVESGTAVCLIVFGGLLIADHRRHAARWAYALIVPTFVEGLLTLALEGVGRGLLSPLAQLMVLVALSVALDPGLIGERRVQLTLRRMDERDLYERDLARGMVGRDETGRGYIALDFFNIFWLFVIGSVFGLALETVYRVLTSGVFEDRAGLLWGPFSPIYGCGAVLLTVCLNRLWRANPVFLFLASAVVGGAFEYATSWFMQTAFGITAWDYTGQWLSIQGRTSGRYMVFWGILGTLWVKLLLPRVLALINLIPWKVRYSLTAVCAVLMVVDIAMTLMALDCWYGRVAGTATDSPVTSFFAEHFGDAVMSHRFQTMHIDPSEATRL
ncbi:putative ABC transporter permease [uncultured Bifidobacterium sp.]|uniref:putative ABC transporter permease n=1 Tax=uncultured Bifidobacterium sp. TaxID=165187 RepID=UPI0028DB4F67|nr:putative ABC transporter permease [uncultured Bifidobacterium sp.]